jgi:general secretion pathway protein M
MNPQLAAQWQQWRQKALEARERFMALQPRERWLVGAGSVVVLVTLLYLAVWEPAVNAHRNRAQGLESARAIAQKLEQAAAQVQQRGPGAHAGQGMSLLAAVDQATKQSGLNKAPSRMEPEGDKEVKLWFEDVPFDGVIPWLAVLQEQYGIRVQTLDVEPRDTAGVVNLRLSLVRST